MDRHRSGPKAANRVLTLAWLLAGAIGCFGCSPPSEGNGGTTSAVEQPAEPAAEAGETEATRQEQAPQEPQAPPALPPEPADEPATPGAPEAKPEPETQGTEAAQAAEDDQADQSPGDREAQSAELPATSPGSERTVVKADPHATVDLARLSEAFRQVARDVKPSVVQVSAEVRPGSRKHSLSSRMSEQERHGMVQQFGPLFELDPELQQFFRGRRFEQQGPDYQQYNVPLPVGSASGWIYDQQGHIVTNHHVVAKADRITLTFHDGSEAEAEWLGSDPKTDVAVLKADHSDLAPARLAAEPVEQGDIVLAIGSPFRYAFSVSQGIVSAKGRQMGILGPQGYENFIQTDAAINPGNSGGPLTNARGQVVGMNTAIASRSGTFAGIGFAIPADMIRDVVEELMRKGKVERGYLGVTISDDEQLLASFGVDDGVVVEDTIGDAPAAKAGIEPGDVIVALDGQSIGKAARLRREVARTDPGQSVTLTVVRDGQRRELEVQLQQQPMADTQAGGKIQSEAAQAESPEAGALEKVGFSKLQTMSSQIASRFGLDQTEGVLVLGVRRFSAAAVAGISRGHIITRVEGARVTDVDQLRGALEQADLQAGVRLRIQTPGGPARFVMLSLGR
jgi:serine protease Do